jgi:hypothetical protein
MSITDVIVRGGGGGGGGGEHCRSPCNGYMSIEAWEPKSPEFSIFTASRKEPSVARRGGGAEYNIVLMFPHTPTTKKQKNVEM